LTSPQLSGTNIPLKATVAPAEAGTVQFYDGGTALGSPVTVAAGVATYTDNRPPAIGGHSYTAVFTPNLGDETGSGTGSATFVGASTSSALPFQINAGPTVSINPTTVQSGGKVQLTFTGWPANASVVLHAVSTTGTVLGTFHMNSSGDLTTGELTVSTTYRPATYNLFAVDGSETAETTVTITPA
jgi:hypothetical protein